MSRTTTGRHFLQIPGPTNVPDEVLRAISAPTIDHRGPEFAELGREVLEALGPVFGTTGPVVVYPSSGTGAWEAALVNTLSPGDAVLAFETGHFALLWQSMASSLGLKVDLVPGDWRHGVDPDVVEERLTADAGHEIKAVCVVHNETSTGVTSRVAEVRGRHRPRRSPRAAAGRHHLLARLDRLPPRRVGGRRDRERLAEGPDAPAGLGFNAVSEKALAASRSARCPRSYWTGSRSSRPTSAASGPTRPPPTCSTASGSPADARRGGAAGGVRPPPAARRGDPGGGPRLGLEILCADEREHSGVLTAILLPTSTTPTRYAG